MVVAVMAAGPLAFAPSAASAGSFMRPPGKGEIILAAGVSTFSRRFDARGSLRRAAVFDKGSVTLHADYGWSERVTLVGLVENDQIQPRIVNDPGRFATWSALAGARLALWQGASGAILSLQALGGVGAGEARSGFEGEARLGLGLPLRLGGADAFLDLQAAWRIRAGPLGDEIRLDATWGVRPHPRWLLLAQLFAAVSAEGGRHPARGEARLKAQLSAVWDFAERWSLQLAVFRTLAGRNAVAETGATLALWHRF